MSRLAHRPPPPVVASGFWIGAGAAHRPRLVAFWDGTTIECEIDPGRDIVIGRARDCDLCVDHRSVSRRHARVICSDPLRVEDLGSANGTRLGIERLAVGARAVLAAGQIVTVGAATLFVQPGSAARAAHPLEGSAPIDAATPWPETGAMGRIEKTLGLFAARGIDLLLVGEPGVDAEVAAAHVHASSPRAAQRFVRCAGAELSTGVPAGCGTLFVDELADAPAPGQAALLAHLQARGRAPVIASTSRDLEPLVASGAFRSDLFQALAMALLRIPPLRERLDEIGPLAERLTKAACARARVPHSIITRSALQALQRHSFPENVRELERLIELAVKSAAGRPIAPEHLGLDDPPFDRTMEDLTPAPSRPKPT